jgi:alpha-beta hydrolase superfamily lysophospholipase
MPDTVSAPFATTIETRGTRLRIVGRPLAAPRGGMIIVPGFAEHAGRWGRLMDDLAARGFASFVYEPRGHGGSSGPRGHTPSWQDLAEDLDAVVEVLEASGRLPARRVLLGASMGGLLVADWLPAHPERFHGLVLVAPFFAPALTVPPAKALLARTAGALWPTLAQPHGLRGRQMSHDPGVIAAYDADRAIVRVMSARYFNEMTAAQARVRAAGAAGIDAPVLLIQGGADPIADWRAAEAWTRTSTSLGSDAYLYPGMRHEPLNELERGRVFTDLDRWLEHQVLAPARPAA